jgi:hypothetical protein
MKNRTYPSLVLSLLLSLLLIGHVLAGEAKEEAAIGSANGWLSLVDAGNHGESWDSAAAIFQGAVSRAQWEQAMQAPGAPDGEYVVIQFSTSFENKASAVETVTPMLDADGEWRVSGYYIR